MNAVAPTGCIWVCQACGKRSRDRYGDQRVNRGWDESCILNALLCDESKLILKDDFVVEILEGGVVKETRKA